MTVLAVTVLAHGVGTRANLPIPVPWAIAGGALAVAVSFLALAVLWREPRRGGAGNGRALPARLQRAIDSRLLTGVLRAAVLAASVLVLAVALLGPADPPSNLAPWALYIQLWVGLVPASLLLGPVWRRVNPLRTVHAALAGWAGDPPGAQRLGALGYYPAAATLLVFTFVELAYPHRSDPRMVGLFLLGYAVVQLWGALWFGPGWFARADAFEVYSSLLGRLAPLGRRDDGRLVLRNPLDAAAALPATRGLAAVVVVLVGGTAFDGLSRTTWWHNGPGIAGDARSLPQAVGLAAVVAAMAALYLAATTAAGRVAGVTDGPARYAASVIPVAAGYAVAHYFSLLVLDGQLTVIVASDPFQRGWDLLGTAGREVDYTLVSPRTISLVQVAAIVGGHVAGVALAHDRAVRLAGAGQARRARAAQYPLLLAMVTLTVGGLVLLLGG